jgi:CheY-like chemotaxis protein
MPAVSLIWMDIQMPVLDGLQATQKIRSLEKQEGRQRIPMLTASVLTV